MTKFFKLSGKIDKVFDMIVVKRVSSPDFRKVTFILTTTDDQVLYPELRNNKIKQLKNIDTNKLVEIEYSFRGSEKNGKYYNNIYINSIKNI